MAAIRCRPGFTVSTEEGSRVVDLPAVPVGYGRVEGSTTTVPVSFPALAGKQIKVTIDAVNQVRALDYYSTFSGATDILPVGIAELGLPVVQPSPPARLPVTCQSGLLRIDGRPVDVEITGTTAAALAGNPVTVRGLRQLRRRPPAQCRLAPGPDQPPSPKWMVDRHLELGVTRNRTKPGHPGQLS